MNQTGTGRAPFLVLAVGRCGLCVKGSWPAESSDGALLIACSVHRCRDALPAAKVLCGRKRWPESFRDMVFRQRRWSGFIVRFSPVAVRAVSLSASLQP